MHNGLKVFLGIKVALLRLLTLRGASAKAAEEILQNMSIKIASDKFGSIAKVRAYLFKMAFNDFHTLRCTDDRRVRQDRDWIDARSGLSPVIDLQPSTRHKLIERAQIVILMTALDRIRKRTRWIFDQFLVSGKRQKRLAKNWASVRR